MNIKFQPLFSTLSVALLLSASVASAGQEGEEKHNKFMQFFEANNDGTVTYEEFQISSKNRFARIDADTNAAASEEEFFYICRPDVMSGRKVTLKAQMQTKIATSAKMSS